MQKISESALQSSMFLWLFNNFPKTRGLVYHVPNGGLRSRVEAGRMKAQGVIPGVPDLHHAIPTKIFASLYVEIKTDEGRLSPEQIKEHEILKSASNRVEIVRSLEEYQALIFEHYSESDLFK